MWSQPLLFFLSALSCFKGVEVVIPVVGWEGGEAKFFCPYDKGYEGYQKYLCGRQCTDDNHVLITTDKAQTGRYSIHDNRTKKVFTVTIADLIVTDAGTYWCGVTRNGKDLYTQAKLDILPDSCCDTDVQVQGVTEASAYILCSYPSEYKDNLKYICRGTQPSVCLSRALVTSDQVKNERFTLTVDQVSSEFTVTVNQLTQLDSGPYLCGVQVHTGLDHLSLVQLSVKEWCCVTLHYQTGTVGRPLQMHCPYPPQHERNLKFLCKGDSRYNCSKVVRSGRSSRRFTLQEDVGSSSFMVTITELRAEDAGMFWCGSDTAWNSSNYVKIQLSVVSPKTTSIYSTVSNHTNVTTEAKHLRLVIIIASVVVAAMLTATVTLVVIYKRKSRKTQGAVVKVRGDNKEMVIACKKVKNGEDIYENAYVDGLGLHDGDDEDDHEDSLYQNFSP